MPNGNLAEDVTARALADARRAAADGEMILGRAHEDIRVKSKKSTKPSTESPPKTIETALGELIANILAAEQAGRAISAGIGLIELRKRLERGADELFWRAFVAETFPFSFDRAQQLIGRLLYRKGVMHCTSCGRQAVCECGCGAPYISAQPFAATTLPAPVASGPLTAVQRAIEAIKAAPEKSNRAIAQALGIGETTVRRAREEHGAPNGAVATNARTGSDGHARVLPRKADDRWKPYRADGDTDCDINPEFDKAFADETDRELRRNAANFQLNDIERMLRKDFALTRLGTQPDEITKTIRKRVRSIKTWVQALDDQLASIQKRER